MVEREGGHLPVKGVAEVGGVEVERELVGEKVVRPGGSPGHTGISVVGGDEGLVTVGVLDLVGEQEGTGDVDAAGSVFVAGDEHEAWLHIGWLVATDVTRLGG